MMNLEVLFQSADLTGNNTLRDIATSHANTRSPTSLCTYPTLVIGQDLHGTLLYITQLPVASSKKGQLKAILTTVHGRAVKHGVYMASRIVCIYLQNNLLSFFGIKIIQIM